MDPILIDCLFSYPFVKKNYYFRSTDSNLDFFFETAKFFRHYYNIIKRYVEKTEKHPLQAPNRFLGGVKNSEKNFVENEISYTFAKY